MVGTILVVLSEGFDDMAYLSTQVILEEAGNDVISSSPAGGAVKGETSSVMTVSFRDAIDQGLSYDALVLIGGNSLGSISELPSVVQKYNGAGKIIAAFATGINILQTAGITGPFSTDSSPVVQDNIFTLSDPMDCEEFVEDLAGKLS